MTTTKPTHAKPTQEISLTVSVTFNVNKYDLASANTDNECLTNDDETNIAGYVLDHLDTTKILDYIEDRLEGDTGYGILLDALRDTNAVWDALPDGYDEALQADSDEYEEYLEAAENGKPDPHEGEPTHIELLDKSLAA